MQVSAQHVAQRINNARVGLIETLSDIASITPAEAEKAAAYYIRHKIVKLDVAMGRYQLSAGVFADAEVIRRAVAA